MFIKCSECKYNVEHVCTNTKRKKNHISLKITTSPYWCTFKKKARKSRGKSPRTMLMKALDDLLVKVCRKRANYRCEITGEPDGEGRGKVLNVHHFIGRSNYRVRWNPDNAVCLTSGKHTLSPWSAHKNPIWFRDLMIEKRGQAWYDNLRTEAGEMGGSIKHTLEDLLEIKKKLEKELYDN